MSSLAKLVWNKDFSGLSVKKAAVKGAKPEIESIAALLKPSAEIDGERIAPSKWTPGKVEASAKMKGFKLSVELKENGAATLKLRNESGKRARIGDLRFSASRDGQDFLSTPGPRLRVYKEGWTMASAAASVRYGDSEFEANAEYKPFAVSEPAAHFPKEKNKFSAEYVAVLNDKESGESALFGFISSAKQVARIAIELDERGVAKLDAIAHCDNVALDDGEELESEELVVMSGADGYGLLEEFASLWAKRMKALSWDHVPTGWCSWYYYFSKVTEADMLENIRWMKENRSEFPLEYIQMDDGYQAALGDWLVCDKAKFPNGLEFLAGEVKKAGFKPGIWLAPFFVEERSKLYAEHPDWMVKDKNGQTVWGMQNWRGSRVAILDCTGKESCAWLTETFATLVKWGYEYVKIDFQAYGAGVLALGGVYADPKATRAMAIRNGLAAIRKGMGDKFILACTSVLGPSVGLVNANRVGTDITPYWGRDKDRVNKESPRVPHVCRNIINRRYMHRKLWLSDPDTHIARIDSNELSEDEVKLWTSAVWLAGGLLLLSDRFSTLAPERAALSKMLLKDVDAFEKVRPLDLFDNEFPSLWLGRRENAPDEEFALGVFNFDEEPKAFKIDLSQAGVKKGAKLSASELWSGEKLNSVPRTLETELKPHSCKVFLFSKA